MNNTTALTQSKTKQKRTTFFSLIKKFIRTVDRNRFLYHTCHRIFWGRDVVKHNIFSKVEFSKPIYIVRREAKFVGLFSYFIRALGGIAYADEHNMLPVVDMKTHLNAYIDKPGVVNSWDYYFEQPGGISLEQALTAKEYTLGRDCEFLPTPDYNNADFFYNRDGKLDYWRKICQKYIRFSPEVNKRLNAFKDKHSGKKILGVLVRGTDYVALKPQGHPIQPTPEEAIAKAKEVMNEKNFDAVYLATEDVNIAQKFKNAFGEKLLLPEQNFLDYDYNSKPLLAFLSAERDNDKYLRGLEYAVSMAIIANCDGLITSMTGGSTGAMCLSKGYEYLYVFDLGLYK